MFLPLFNMVNIFINLSVVICVYCIMSSPEIFLSQDDIFQHSTGCTRKFFSFRKPWWQPLVYTSLISQSQENMSAVLIFWLTPWLCYHCSCFYSGGKIIWSCGRWGRENLQELGCRMKAKWGIWPQDMGEGREGVKPFNKHLTMK